MHGLDRVVVITARENDASIRVLEKVGLRLKKLVRLSDESPEICLFSTPIATSLLWP